MLETEGLTQLEANKSARVPALDRDELDIVYEMRERIETLALRLSLPHLTGQQESEICIASRTTSKQTMMSAHS